MLKEENNPLVDIWDNIVKGVFNDIPTNGMSDPTNIYVDLDSCLSILTSQDLPEDEEDKVAIIRNSIKALADYLDLWKNTAFIHIYYSFKKSNIINKYIPDWNIKRNERLSSPVINILIDQLIGRLKKIKLKNLKLIECEDSTIINIAKDIKTDTSAEVEEYNKKGKGYRIISRDVHYQCLLRIYPYLEIFNGNHIVDKNIFRFTKGYPLVISSLVPYYYALVGMQRHDFKGVAGYGPIKATNYIKARYQDILNGKDELFNTDEVKNILKVMLINTLFED